ncbi:MAG: hypothetical protein ACKPAH_00700 [Verrucomicrobiota bacterium]
MRLPAWLHPRSWLPGREDRPSAPHGTGNPKPGGVPLGSVKALPETLARRFLSFENRRMPAPHPDLVQGELRLPAATPLRNDLFEDDVELVRRRREGRLLHETRPPGAAGTHDPELAFNRLRGRDPVDRRLVATRE